MGESPHPLYSLSPYLNKLPLEGAGALAAKRLQADLPTDMATDVISELQRASAELASLQSCGSLKTGES